MRTRKCNDRGSSSRYLGLLTCHKGPYFGCVALPVSFAEPEVYISPAQLYEQQSLLASMAAYTDLPTAVTSATPSAAQSSPPPANNTILIAYQVVSAQLQVTDTYEATSYDPRQVAVGNPCTGAPLGWSNPTTQNTVGSSTVQLPADMDIKYNGVAYKFHANKWDLAGGLQIISNATGALISTCKRLPSSQASQQCGAGIIETLWATCTWYSGGGASTTSTSAIPSKSSAPPASPHPIVCTDGWYDESDCSNSCLGLFATCSYQYIPGVSGTFGQSGYECSGC